MGDIEEGLIFPYPELPDSGKEILRDVLGSVDSLMGAHAGDFRHWDHKGEFPDSFVEELRQFGMFGLVIPGGARRPRLRQRVLLAHAAAGRALRRLRRRHDRCPQLDRHAWAPAVRQHQPARDVLPRSGDRQAHRGLLSDRAWVRLRRQLDPHTAEQEGDHWVLNGEKLWITNGGYAGFFTVFAKTSSEGSGRMTAFLVTPEMGGVSVGPHEDKMGIRASSTTTVTFDGTRVPADHVLGDVGAGFKVAMAILNNGRTGLGGGSVGAMKHVIGLAAQHARDRKQFGKPIAEFGLVKQKLGRMLVDCYAAESVVNLVAHMIDSKSQDYASRPRSVRCSPARRSGA